MAFSIAAPMLTRPRYTTAIQAIERARAGSLFRYGLALAGPGITAASQFLLSLVLLRVLAPAAFGSFSILLIVTQFSWSLWTALFCAPMPLLLRQTDMIEREATERSLMAANLCGAAAMAGVIGVVARLLGLAWPAAVLFGAYGGVGLLRWFARAYAYAVGRQLRTTGSDLVSGVCVLSGVIAMALLGLASMVLVGALLLVSTIVAMLPFGAAFLAAQFAHVRLMRARGYADVWRRYAGWSLLGVITTEATANAHSYLVTLLRGPGAFAPIAASGLVVRPLTVGMNALVEFERARMGIEIAGARMPPLLAAVRLFRLVLVAIWVVTGLAVAALLIGSPHLLFPARYDLRTLVIGAVLWMAVGGVRMLRTPDNALLQAAGAFRALAMASVGSSAVSVVLVLLLIVTTGPLWSILGILAGEAVFAVAVWLTAARWLHAFRAGLVAPVDPIPGAGLMA